MPNPPTGIESNKRKKNTESQRKSREKKRKEDERMKRTYTENCKRISELEKMAESLSDELFGQPSSSDANQGSSSNSGKKK